MELNQDFLLGFVSGTVVGAVGYRLYEQNSGQLQRLLQPTRRVSSASTNSTAFIGRACCTKRKIRGFNCRTANKIKRKKAKKSFFLAFIIIYSF